MTLGTTRIQKLAAHHGSRRLKCWRMNVVVNRALAYSEKSAGTDSVLNGPKSAVRVRVNLPFRFLGTCHRAEHVKPQPYSNLPEVISLLLLSRISYLGASGRLLPILASVIARPWSVWNWANMCLRLSPD